MPLFGSTNVEKLKSRRDVTGLVNALSDSDDAIASAAARALGELKDAAAIESLVAVTMGRNMDVRSAAMEALGDIGSPAAIEPLRAALHGCYDLMLGSLSESLGPNLDAMVLGRVLFYATLATKGIESLGKLRAADTVDSLVKALNGDAPSKAVDLLVEHKMPSANQQQVGLIALAGIKVMELRKAAATALEAIGGPEAERALAEYRTPNA